MRKTRIICTLGPASSSYESIRSLAEAGMDVARLNFSHGSHEDHDRNIETIKTVAEELKRPIAVLQDLQGPKIRIGKMPDGVELISGKKLVLTPDAEIGSDELLPCSYADLAHDLKNGDTILLNDGKIKLGVEEISGKDVHAYVIVGGPVSSHKGLNLPDASISAPPLTEKDLADLEFGLSREVDYVAVSFVRSPDDVLMVKEKIKEHKGHAQVVSKIERHEAVDNLVVLGQIIAASDAVMVARGDLGVEIPLERVPIIQKTIINMCDHDMKPVIIATQMLESMIESPTPTRAEVSDVANAIIDGADATMLSGETAVGKYPVDAVRVMSRSAEAAEAVSKPVEMFMGEYSELEISNAVGYSACNLAENLGARAIVCFTEHGFTARMISKYRPNIQIVAAADCQGIRRRMCLYWGVQSFLIENHQTTDAMIRNVEKLVLEHGVVDKGDIIVITAGLPKAITGHTNMIKVHRVGAE